METGYKCKNCVGYLCGYYVRLKEKLYFRGKCKCSYWLVKSTHLKDTFDKANSRISIR